MPREPLLERRVEAVVRGVHVGELRRAERLAVAARHLHGVEHVGEADRSRCRSCRCASPGPRRRDRSARRSRRCSRGSRLRAPPGGGIARSPRSGCGRSAARNRAAPRRRAAAPGKHSTPWRAERGEDRREIRVGERLRQVDAGDARAEYCPVGSIVSIPRLLIPRPALLRGRWPRRLSRRARKAAGRRHGRSGLARVATARQGSTLVPVFVTDKDPRGSSRQHRRGQLSVGREVGGARTADATTARLAGTSAERAPRLPALRPVRRLRRSAA